MPEDSQTPWFIDLIGAIICGLLLSYVPVSAGDEGVDSHTLIKPMIFAVCSYSTIALLLSLKGKWRVIKIPTWILIALLGTLVTCLALVTINNQINGWPSRSGLPLFQYAPAFLAEVARDAIFSTIWFGLPSLLIMGANHYVGGRLYRILMK
jgi:hypothetical protein